MPATPDDKGWPAYQTSAYAFRDQYRANSSSTPLPRISCIPVVLSILAILFFFSRFVEYLFRALFHGFWEVLFLLLIFHLPWLAYFQHLKRLFARTRHLMASSGTTQPLVLQDSSGAIHASPVHIRENGLQNTTFTGWEQFSRYQYQGEVERYYRVRLWYHSWGSKPKGLLQRLNNIGVNMMLLSPPVLTFCLACWGFNQYGLREDVLVAAALAAIYLVIKGLLSYFAARIVPETTLPSTDLLLNSEVVTATDFLAFLERYLPQNNEGSTT